MLDVKHNRLNYGEMLTPPKGYSLSKAVGTTYSLDLFALLAIPVSMFYSKSMEGDFTQNRYDVLDAIRRSKEKVDLFCQRGKIHVPSKYNSLLAFMEDCIVEINPPAFNASFHPKIWVLKFEQKEKVLYRLVVLSRNLTFDRSWDIAVYTEGKPTDKNHLDSKHLAAYLRKLYSYAGKEFNEKFMSELSTVDFSIPNSFKSLSFFPIINFEKEETGFKNPLKGKIYEDLLIISPFIDKSTLNDFKRSNKNFTLISRQEELDILEPEVLKGLNIYCLNPMVISGEDIIDTEGEDQPLIQNLHAKIFIGSRQGETEWFLGSANCTDPAFTRNAEFLMGLKTDRKSSSLKSIKNILLKNENNIFHKYSSKEIVDEEKIKIDQLLRKLTYVITSSEFIGHFEKNIKTNNYNLYLTAVLNDFLEDSFEIKVRLITSIEPAFNLIFGQEQSFVFENIPLVNISQFIILDIYYCGEKQSSIAVKIQAEIPEDREDVIFQSLINNKEKFYQYLQFLLSPEDFTDSLLIDNNSFKELFKNKTTDTSLPFNAPVYENLLLAASRNPEKLIEIERIMQRLEKFDSKIVEDFQPIWNVFKEFAYAK